MSVIAIELIHPFNGTVLQKWQFEASCQQVTIGRSKLSDIRLTSKLVSRHHATLQSDIRGWWLEVEGANGCYVDGFFADGTYLRSNSTISIGKSGPTLRFLICGELSGDDCAPVLEAIELEVDAFDDSEPSERALHQQEPVGSASVAGRKRAESSEDSVVSLEELLIDRDTWYGDD